MSNQSGFPQGRFTIRQAADWWIDSVRGAAAPEAQKQEMIEKIERGAQAAIGSINPASGSMIEPESTFCFADARNHIGRMIQERQK